MAEGLDLLKQEWKKQNKNLPKYSQNELYSMLQKKSTSIVKWIFIISILEFLFWIGIEVLTYLYDFNEIIDQVNLTYFYRITLIINYVVIITFIALFFSRYKNINVADNSKKLMKSIIKTRNTVKAYVWFNVVIFIFSFIVSNYFTLQHMEIDMEGFIWGYILAVFVIMLVFVGLLLLFYRIIYGTLIRRLYKNYEQLKKLEL
ncbi:hypothetical protein [Psychroflexus maritimus]|uniref:Uncharacterized protein n=1 Tax=Psychroflexus maritimus TaxID=2714865 RepID=A0A967AGA2_9FLAO|nr:hypothetical protein [Psychroflexus maritimus]NGZ88890.1 hypothetical protein [Psychroflexus maritimus]